MSAANPGESQIEKMLKIQFASDPTRSRFPLPEAPKGHPADRPYPFPSQRITPEVARDWLTYRIIRREITPTSLLHDDFCANRRFIIGALSGSPTRKGLVQKIKDGEWNDAIAQGLIFTPDGFILDGQHRLAACALAGKDIELPISVNAPWKTFADTDDNRARTASQLLDIPYARLATAISRYLAPGIEQTDRDEWQRRDMRRQDILDMVMGWPYFQSSWMKEIAVASQASGVPQTPLGAAVIAALACDADKDMVQRFLNAMMKTFNPSEFSGTNDPRWQLKNLFQNPRKRGDAAGRLDNGEQRGNAGLIRRAMTLWLEGEEQSQIGRTAQTRSLPPFWHGERLAAFHAKHVS